MSAAPRVSSLPVVHRSPITLPDYFVTLPRPLLADIRNNPLAIGVYALIARVFGATRQSVPLSPADIVAYDPSLSPTRAARALDRLLNAGFLVQAPSGGRRNAYRPTWGRIGGEPRPWDLDVRLRDRPRHIATQSLPQALLDHYIGRLEPHPTHGANITRYITQPLLTLEDLGVYALLSAGYPAQSDTLDHYGLVRAGAVQPPLSLQETLALVTQRRLFEAESPTALTPAGWAKLGFTPPAPAEPVGEVLMFVPAGQQLTPHPHRYPQPHPQPYPCSHLCSHPHPDLHHSGQSIGVADDEECAFSASQWAEGNSVAGAARSHGISGIEGKETHHQPIPFPASASNGGGEDSSSIRTKDRQKPADRTATRTSGASSAKSSARTAKTNAPPASEPASVESSARAGAATSVESPVGGAPTAASNETLTLLREVGVRRDVAAKLADRRPEQVKRVIASARDQKGVRNIAGWVVSALRALPIEEEPAAPPPPKVSDKGILLHRGLTNDQRVRWLWRFRNAELADRPGILERFWKAHPPETDILLSDEPYGPAY